MGKKRKDYVLDPLRIELKNMYLQFYKKGVTNYDLLDDKSVIKLQKLYNKINIAKNKKYTIENSFQTHYSQYTREIRKQDKASGRLKDITNNKIKNYNKKVEQNKVLAEQSKQELNNIKQEVEKEKILGEHKMREIKKEQISYIAQKGFLQEFENTDFYKKNTISILNQQAMINNYLKKAFSENFDGYDKKFIIDLMDINNQLLSAIGIDKLMQLQPQALTMFLQQNNVQNNQSLSPDTIQKLIDASQEKALQELKDL